MSCCSVPEGSEKFASLFEVWWIQESCSDQIIKPKFPQWEKKKIFAKQHFKYRKKKQHEGRCDGTRHIPGSRPGAVRCRNDTAVPLLTRNAGTHSEESVCLSVCLYRVWSHCLHPWENICYLHSEHLSKHLDPSGCLSFTHTSFDSSLFYLPLCLMCKHTLLYIRPTDPDPPYKTKPNSSHMWHASLLAGTRPCSPNILSEPHVRNFSHSCRFTP